MAGGRGVAGAKMPASPLGECQGDGRGREPRGVAGLSIRRSGRAEDAELLHTGFKCRSLEAQDLRGAALAADPPAGLLENGDDVLALDVLEVSRLRLRASGGGGGGRGGHEAADLEPALRR